MTLLAATDAPAVLVVSASQVGARSGALLREVAAGTLVRIDDLRLRRTVGWLTAEPPEAAAGLALPEPGQAADSPGPEAP